MKGSELPEEIKNWLYFAEEDARAAAIMMKEQIFNKVCFLSQQCVEKALKAFLLSQQNLPRRTHKLIELLALCGEVDRDFRGFEEQCLELDRYYLPTRYPDALIGTLPEGLPGRKEAESTLEIATEILEFVKGKLKT
jgi:HEPN domain-containing protein